MLGLDNAGKSTILQCFRVLVNNKGIVQPTIPTIGFNVDTFEYKNLQMTIWDIGGQTKIRTLWEHYYYQTDALIFVIDSTDHDRANKARLELYNLITNLQPYLRYCLVFVNKQDRLDAKNVDLMEEFLCLYSFENLSYDIVGCSGLHNHGVNQGLILLGKNML